MADITESEHALESVATAISASNASVEQVGLSLDAIAAASEEQRKVSLAALADIEAIAAMARENGAAVEQNAAAAQRLEIQAGELQATVRRFRT